MTALDEAAKARYGTKDNVIIHDSWESLRSLKGNVLVFMSNTIYYVSMEVLELVADRLHTHAGFTSLATIGHVYDPSACIGSLGWQSAAKIRCDEYSILLQTQETAEAYAHALFTV